MSAEQAAIIKKLLFRIDQLEQVVYGGPSSDDIESKVLLFIKRKGKATVNCVNKGVRSINNAEHARAVLATLENSGDIKKVNDKEWRP